MTAPSRAESEPGGDLHNGCKSSLIVCGPLVPRRQFSRPSRHRRNTTERRQAVAAGAVRGIDQPFGIRVPGWGGRVAVVVSEAALGPGLPILYPKLPVA